jgi:carnosine N-methyltransferase
LDRYIDCINHILKPGGVWINLGPLLYHWVADVEANEDERYGQSIELSYEEIKHVIDTFGFEWFEESYLQNVYYTRHAKSLMATQYK